MTDQNIAQFIALTSADEATARFFLEAAKGDLDSAISQFFEHSGSTPSTSIPIYGLYLRWTVEIWP
jgi:hypothetical protein